MSAGSKQKVGKPALKRTRIIGLAEDKALHLRQSLTSIAKHSQATGVTVSIGRNGDHISLGVEDNGGGFDLERFRAKATRDRGLGLAVMEERARMLGGSFSAKSRQGKGTSILFRIPTHGGARP